MSHALDNTKLEGVSGGVRGETCLILQSHFHGAGTGGAYKTLYVVLLSFYSVFGHRFRPTLPNVSTPYTYFLITHVHFQLVKYI